MAGLIQCPLYFFSVACGMANLNHKINSLKIGKDREREKKNMSIHIYMQGETSARLPGPSSHALYYWSEPGLRF